MMAVPPPATGYEVGASVGFRALHRMPVEGPEGELHSHDYRVDVVVGRRELDEHGMVIDLDVLRAALAAATRRVEGEDLESIRPPVAEAVTVEVLAKWFHETLADDVRRGGGETLAIRAWESDTEFGGFTSPVRDA